MRRLLALSLLLAAAVATPGQAQSAKPAPGCAGLAFTDESGDVSLTAGPTASNLDVIGGFFNTDAKGVVTANLQIADLSLRPAPPATAVTWYVTYVVGATTHYVSLESDVTGATAYDYGIYEADEASGTATYSPVGPTTGSAVEGPEGVVTIVVPKAAQGSVGKKLTMPAAQTSPLIQNGLGGGVLLPGDDTAPEDGTTYEAGVCELGLGGAAAPAPAPAPKPAPAAGGTAAPALPLKLVSKSVKARKGRLAIKLKASEAVTKVGARVRKGTRSLGTGRLARIAKGKTGTVRVKAKKARRGSYLLDVTARLADGRLASRTFRLKVR